MERAIQRDKKIDPDQLRRMQLAEGEFPLIFWKSDLDIAYKNDKSLLFSFLFLFACWSPFLPILSIGSLSFLILTLTPSFHLPPSLFSPLHLYSYR